VGLAAKKRNGRGSNLRNHKGKVEHVNKRKNKAEFGKGGRKSGHQVGKKKRKQEAPNLWVGGGEFR